MLLKNSDESSLEIKTVPYFQKPRKHLKRDWNGTVYELLYQGYWSGTINRSFCLEWKFFGSDEKLIDEGSIQNGKALNLYSFPGYSIEDLELELIFEFHEWVAYRERSLVKIEEPTIEFSEEFCLKYFGLSTTKSAKILKDLDKAISLGIKSLVFVKKALEKAQENECRNN